MYFLVGKLRVSQTLNEHLLWLTYAYHFDWRGVVLQVVPRERDLLYRRPTLKVEREAVQLMRFGCLQDAIVFIGSLQAITFTDFKVFTFKQTCFCYVMMLRIS